MEERRKESMQRELIEKLASIFFIIFGMGFLVFHKSMAQFAVTMWRKHLIMRPPSEMGYQILFAILGIFFIVMGLLMILRVIHFGE